jgi:hypothetical protein
MSLRIGAALQSGLTRLASRAGAALVVAYLVLYAVYQTAFNSLVAAAYARYGLDVSVQTAVDLPLPVAAAVVGVSMVVMSYLSVVAVRTFVAGERGGIPRAFLTDGAAWATLNLLVGGFVFMILWVVGLVLLVVPGLFLLVSLVFMTMYVAVENENFVTAMRRSWGLARGNRLSIFGLLVVVLALGFAMGLGFSVLSFAVTLAGVPELLPLLTAVLTAPVTMYNLAALSAAFDQLRNGAGTPAL